jgi:hypothetical protein
MQTVAAIPKRAAADYESRLQVGLSEGAPPSKDGLQVQHLHSWHATSGLAHDVRRVAKSVAVDVVEIIKQNFAYQIPQGFQLVELSEAIVSDVGSLLRLLPKTQPVPLLEEVPVLPP